jgi:hypothetical protein
MDDFPLGWFHWQHGWYFRRADDGSVEVRHIDGDGVIGLATIPGDEWCSIVAAVSCDSGTSATYAAARVLHHGGSLLDAEEQ